MSDRSNSLIAGMAAGAFLTCGLVLLGSTPVAHADGDDGSPGADTDFIYNTTNFFDLFTDTAAADPGDDHFVAMVLQIPSLGITDVLTSGTDPSDSLAALGAFGETGIGEAGVTLNTFQDSMDPALDSTFSLPFTDPLAEVFTALIPLGF